MQASKNLSHLIKLMCNNCLRRRSQEAIQNLNQATWAISISQIKFWYMARKERLLLALTYTVLMYTNPLLIMEFILKILLKKIVILTITQLIQIDLISPLTLLIKIPSTATNSIMKILGSRDSLAKRATRTIRQMTSQKVKTLITRRILKDRESKCTNK